MNKVFFPKKRPCSVVPVWGCSPAELPSHWCCWIECLNETGPMGHQTGDRSVTVGASNPPAMSFANKA